MRYRILSMIVIGILAIAGGVAMAMHVPSDIKDLVVFVYVKDTAGNARPAGTAFFVGVPVEGNPERSFVYIVTAKHVLTRGDGGPFLQEVYVRLDKRDGGTDLVAVPLTTSGNKRTVFVHSDSNVDLAVIPAVPSQERYQYRILPVEMIPEQKHLSARGIAEGTEVFFAGLFTPHVGQQQSYPIVRFGHVSLLSDEKISWNGKMLELYLVETGTYGGNSGSPVFFYQGADRTPGVLTVGSPKLTLAGVMKGAFEKGSPIKVVSTGAVPYSLSNLGIAAVIPGFQIREILFGEQLKQRREGAAEAGG
jgi:hypothetical protein